MCSSDLYPKEVIEELVQYYSLEKLEAIQVEGHFYIAEWENKLLGCGAIVPCQKDGNVSEIITMFVQPDTHGMGIGKAIMTALEQDIYGKKARKIVLSASITARDFYLNLGYKYQQGITTCNEDGLFLLEKQNK